MKAKTAFVALLVSACTSAPRDDAANLGAAGALAQTVEVEISRVEPSQRFTVSARACLGALERKERDASRAWCAVASRQAVSKLDARGYPFDNEALLQPELEIVRKALWLDAVDGLGLQKDPWWGSPRSETIPLKREVRRLSYVMFADFNRRNFGLLDFQFERLGSVVGVDRDPKETLGGFRLRVLDQLGRLEARLPLEGLTAQDILWARSAIALTLFIDDQKSDLVLDSTEVESRIGDARKVAFDASGEDTALRPAALLALGYAQYFAGKPTDAFHEGADACPKAIWVDAALCRLLATADQQALALARAPIPADRLVARTLQRTFNPH